MAKNKSSTIQPVNKHIKRSKKISEKRSDDDRISKLPEPVLHHILCFLSTEEAAKTSVLSKPWRYLWTWVPDLDINHFHNSGLWGRPRVPRKDISLESMFVSIFLSRRAWCIRKLRLTLSSSCHYDPDSIRSILCSAVERNVEELDLRVHDDFCDFPSSLFCCKTLVVLKMRGESKIGIGSSVHLPRLKVLHLENVQFKDADTVRNLLSGCPVLDRIFIGIYEIDTRFPYEISSLTARHVRFSLSTFDPFVQTRITVTAPALEYLTIDYNVERSPHVLVLNNVSSSVHATYNIRPGDGDEEIEHYWEPMKGIFGALCNVQSLELNFVSIEEHPDHHNIPISFFPGFDNLVQLKLVIDFCPLPLLLNLLPNCSRLEHLTLVSKMWNPCTMSHSSISPQQVPNCLAFHLTTIMFERFQGFEAEIEFIQYVINNSKVLRSIAIRYKNNTDLDRKLAAFQKISGFVKESATRCQLTFQEEL